MQGSFETLNPAAFELGLPMYFYLGNVNPSRSLFTCSLVWNCIVAHQMLLEPSATLRALSHIKSAGWVATDLIQVIGGLRLGNAALALQGLLTPDRPSKKGLAKYTSAIFAFGGMTNVIVGLVVLRRGRFGAGRLLALLLVEASLASGHLLHFLSFEDQ